MTRPQQLLPLIEGIQVRGSTALYTGWAQGATEGGRNLSATRLNRVVLLTDGQANVGQTNPDVICDAVHQAAVKGLQTTTLGFGADYNEALLRSMAASGGGNHFFVESPEQLTQVFEVELDAMSSTIGSAVRLRLLPLAEGVTVEPLGEIESREGAYLLSDLIADFRMEQLFRLHLPAGVAAPLTARLSWHSPHDGQEHVLDVPLELPLMASAERLALEPHPEVEQSLAVAMAARARREAVEAMRAGRRDDASRMLDRALRTHKLPAGEKSRLERLKGTLDRGDVNVTSKMAMSQSHSYSRGSVNLGGIEGHLIEGLIDSGTLPIQQGRFVNQGPAAAQRGQAHSQGMLRGLFAGADGSEAAALSLATLRALGYNRHPLQFNVSLIESLAKAPVAQPSPSFLEFQERHRQGIKWPHTGVATPDAGALRRVAPLTLGRLEQGGVKAVAYVLLGSALTHNNTASLVSCLWFSALLWDLMALPSPPAPRGYLEHFQRLVGDLETGTVYRSRAPRYDGWEGKLSEYVALVIPEARARGLTVAQAMAEWGSDDYLLATVPCLLYLLESHAHQPQRCLVEAAAAQDPGTLGALAGAAMGALHGTLPDWKVAPGIDQEIERVCQA
ncbi:MAG: ADP-ribosylglycohydrolase family protein [Candidatus Eremiobacteraeota bacterium]|nr:ADP-ribosylglycohydrolase family protein [Candidatus Eremiobacteraeota bacterium]